MALALILFFGCAAANVSNVTLHPFSASPKSEMRFIPGPSGRDLPNDCAIIASEAASRLAATGAWTRIIVIKFSNPRTKVAFSHALAVWQPPTSHVVCTYERFGMLELRTTRHEPERIGKEWAHIEGVTLIEAHFVQ